MKKLMLLSLIVAANLFAEAASPQGGLAASPIIPLLVIFGIFYFLVLRPQQKKAKDHQKFLTELKKGDMVVTNSGIIGTVRMVSDKFVTLEVDDDVNLKILKNQIAENAASLKDEAKNKAILAPQEERK